MSHTALEFDPNCDPAKLAKIGAHVTKKLDTNANIDRIECDLAQIYVYIDFLTPAECKMLIGKIDQDVIPSKVCKGSEQEGFRTSYSCNLNRWDDEITCIEERMSKVMGIHNDFAETMQGQRYEVGQLFKPHHDFFHTSQAYWKNMRVRGGQRSWTAMIFLNEPDEGGTTEFPELGLGIRPKRGMMLIWNNMQTDGTPNYKTLHSGTVVKQGTKYIITKWYRQNNWLKQNPPAS